MKLIILIRNNNFVTFITFHWQSCWWCQKVSIRKQTSSQFVTIFNIYIYYVWHVLIISPYLMSWCVFSLACSAQGHMLLHHTRDRVSPPTCSPALPCLWLHHQRPRGCSTQRPTWSTLRAWMQSQALSASGMKHSKVVFLDLFFFFFFVHSWLTQKLHIVWSTAGCLDIIYLEDLWYFLVFFLFIVFAFYFRFYASHWHFLHQGA